jgi:aminoglycoside phosphotransferase (APT) family kinase protein
MLPEPTDDHIAEALLAYLRVALKQPHLSYAEPPARIKSGLENRVYSLRLDGAGGDFSRPLILRILSSLDDPSRADKERALHNALTKLGFPVPRVLMSVTDLRVVGSPFTLMERVPGFVAIEGTIGMANILRIWLEVSVTGPRRLADVQSRLHRLDAGAVVRAMEQAGYPGEPPNTAAKLAAIHDRIERASIGGLRDAIAWMIDRQPLEDATPAVICHGDLWLGNIIMDGSRVSAVIDWSMAALAPREYDVGVTSVGMQFGLPEISGFFRAFLPPIQYDSAHRYLRAYARRNPIDRDLLAYYQAMRCLEICSWVAERRLGIAGAIRDDAAPNLWDLPGSTDGFEAHFRRCAGISLRMPPATLHFLY